MDEEAAFVVEYASNARSKCANKPCSLKIEKGCIRIGLAIFRVIDLILSPFLPTPFLFLLPQGTNLLFFFSSKGRLVANPFHEGDQMTKWYHAECIFIALTRARSTTKKIG